MRNRSRSLIALGAAAALGLGAAGTAGSASAATSTPSKALTLSSSGKTIRIVSLANGAPLTNAVGLTRFVGDTKLIGIDVRVQDKLAYGVGNQGGVYTINRSTGSMSKVSQLTTALEGASFGVDFNPAADRLRVISDTGQNLRHDLGADTTTADGTLAYVAGTPASGLTSAAYTNNDLDPKTATTLFDIDTALDQVAQQVPANAGSLVVAGSLGVDVSTVAGFDIASSVSAGRTVGNTGYATLRSSASALPTLYKVDLLSGSVTKVAAFRGDVADIAITLP